MLRTSWTRAIESPLPGGSVSCRARISTALRVALHRFVADGLENRAEVGVVGRVVRAVERVPIDDPHDGEQVAALELFEQQPPAGQELPSSSRIAKLHASVPNADVAQRLPIKNPPGAPLRRKVCILTCRCRMGQRNGAWPRTRRPLF